MLKNNQGFTLLEIIMVVAIIGIFIAIVYGYLGHNLKTLGEKNEDSHSYLQARTAMLSFTSDLNQYQKLQITPQGIIQGITYEKSKPDNLIKLNEEVVGCQGDQRCLYYYDGGSLTKNGNIIASNIDFNLELLDLELVQITDSESFESTEYLKVVVTTYSTYSEEKTLEFSTTLRLNSKRPGL